MREVSDQVPADLLLPFQRPGHLVERPRQLPQLPRRADLPHPGSPVPGRHGPGHRDQQGDRPGDPPRRDQGGDQSQQRRQPGRPGDGPQQRGLQHAVGGIQPRPGGPGHDHAHPLAVDHHRRAGLRACLHGEAG